MNVATDSRERIGVFLVAIIGEGEKRRVQLFATCDLTTRCHQILHTGPLKSNKKHMIVLSFCRNNGLLFYFDLKLIRCATDSHSCLCSGPVSVAPTGSDRSAESANW